ncbi:hypothetical protein NX029_12680 [Cytobacillus firmus]|nr:hypothetical protein [Cytobacillus firmus]
MLRILSVLSILFLLMLTACSNSKTLNFSGETDNWSAELMVTQTKDDYEKQEFKLNYKGKDVNSVGGTARILSFLSHSLGRGKFNKINEFSPAISILNHRF